VQRGWLGSRAAHSMSFTQRRHLPCKQVGAAPPSAQSALLRHCTQTPLSASHVEPGLTTAQTPA
jgi:hypothetical protein